MKKGRKRIAGFEIIGSIAVLQLKKQTLKEIKGVTLNILKEHKNIKTVALKTGKVSGRLRKRKLRILAGHKALTTIHKENNCLMKLNIESCYFSPRLSNERLEIARKIKGKKKVLVMFAGILPYALVAAKLNPKAQVKAIELSKEACRYAEENVKLNKLNNLKIIQGDVKKIIPKLKKRKEKFDYIIMPRPQLKETFLSQAFKISKKGTIIFFYDFLQEEQIPLAGEKIQQEAKKAGKKVKLLGIKKAGEVAPYRYRVRIDFKVL